MTPHYVPQISINDFTYLLPQDRIALYPLEERDSSKQLIANAKTSTIRHSVFKSLASELPAHSLLVVNDTKVIHARLAMKKQTGGEVEILLIEPSAGIVAELALQQRGRTTPWLCIVGGKNVQEGMVLSSSDTNWGTIQARIISRMDNKAIVEFDIQPSTFTLAEILSLIGNVPLPPYLHRPADDTDDERYQTVYAVHNGSVAAPTAGLHFTDRVFSSLHSKEIEQVNITLHVGLGTFEPVKVEMIDGHEMHREYIAISKATLHRCIQFFADRSTSSQSDENPRFVCTGTTSLRTMESLYWIGVRIMNGEVDSSIMESGSTSELLLDQWCAYRLRDMYATTSKNLPSVLDSFNAIAKFLDTATLDILQGQTRMIIVPPYTPMVCDALITNFHQPNSTLMLLVASFLSGDFWKDVYKSALENDYRFLSYGDSSLLLR
jgi:S-adenosylmethionine:tRNA ribosyltransferase-isomerase